MKTPARAVIAVLVLLVLATPGAASAAGEVEPNNGIHQAQGGLLKDTSYDADMDSNDDSDWYIVHVSGQGTLTVAFRNTADDICCSWPNLYLRNQDGELISWTDGTQEPDLTWLTHQTSGPGVYYLEVGGAEALEKYRLRVTGPVVPGPAPGSATATPNTNGTAQSAYGPLVGAKLYAGSLDGFGEQDWFYFYTSGPGEFDVALTNVAEGECCGWPDMTLSHPDGRRINTTAVAPNRIGHLRFTAAGRAKFLLRIHDAEAGDRYRLSVGPAGMITTQPPPTTPTTPTDSDGDGVPDSSDQCPTQPGPSPSGCPAEPNGDLDGDGVPDASDNCPRHANAAQSDLDGDRKGDACDEDDDGDGRPDVFDSCPTQAGSPGRDCPLSAACKAERSKLTSLRRSLDAARNKLKAQRTKKARRKWKKVYTKRRAAYLKQEGRAHHACSSG